MGSDESEADSDNNHGLEALSRERLYRGIGLFLALSVAGLAVLFIFTVRGEATLAIQSISLGFLALAFATAVLDLLIGAFRYQIFLRKIDPDTSLWLPIRADLANRFAGAVTPSQTGGGPAQIFVLHRGGIPLPKALSFLAINFSATVAFFLISGGVAAYLLRDHFAQASVQWLLRYGFTAVLALFGAFLVALLRPDLIVRPLERFVERRRSKVESGPLTRLLEWMVRNLDRYRAACTLFIRESPMLLVQSFLLTVVLYANKYTMAYLIMRGLGADGDYLMVLAVQALLHVILYAAPSPGGSGIAELSTGALMAVVMPVHLVGFFTVGYRFFLTYLPALVGGFVLAAEFKALRRKPMDAGPRQGRGHWIPRWLGGVGVLMALMASLGTVPGSRLTQASAAIVPSACHASGRIGPSARVVVSTVYCDGVREARRAITRGMSAQAVGNEKEAKRAFVEAEESASDAVAAHPNGADGHYWLAVALGLRLEHEGVRTKVRLAGEVLAHAEKALEIDPEHAGAHHVLGRMHAGAMRAGRIVRFFAQRILGAELFGTASWEQAQYHLSRARDLDPTSIASHLELGVVFLDTSQPELARIELEDVVRLQPAAQQDSLYVQRAETLLAELNGETRP